MEILLQEPFCGEHALSMSCDDDSVSKEVAKIDELSTKLQILSVRNVNKRLRRREQKLSRAQTQVKEMEKKGSK